MTKIPEPQHTPDGPAYEGRLLHRADDEVVDQGAAFDIDTLFSRRSMIGLVGAGLGALALAACGTDSAQSGAQSGTQKSAGSLVEIPDETAGPYPGDGSNGPDILEMEGIIRRDIRSSIGGGATAEGVPMTLGLTILDMAKGNVPFADAAVYVWHCDASGAYSLYSTGVENESYLRGVQVADKDGKVTFTSIFPACYPGRWPHIHFEVYPTIADIKDSSKAISTSQVALPQDVSETVYALDAYKGSRENLSQVSLTSDNVFSDDGGAQQLATVTGDSKTGYQVHLTVGVDTATEPTGGSAPGGGGMGDGGAPPKGGPGGSGGSGGAGGSSASS